MPCQLSEVERAISSDGSAEEEASPSGAWASPSREWQHPPSFLCPISQQCMHDPVVLSDGHTYERQHIERWLAANNTSPVTRRELSKVDMYPNHALRNAIQEYSEEVFGVHRRAIRRSIRSRRGTSDFSTDAPLMRTVDALIQCSLLVNGDHSVEYILRQIMLEAKKLVGAEVASVFLVDFARQELYSTVNSTDAELRIPLNAGIAGHVATSGEADIINDAYADSRFNKDVDKKTGLRTRNILCAPLTVRKGNVIGVVQLINKTGGGVTVVEGLAGSQSEISFTSDDSHFLQVFASQAATAVAHGEGAGSVPAAPPVAEPSPTAEPSPKACLAPLLLPSAKRAPQHLADASPAKVSPPVPEAEPREKPLTRKQASSALRVTQDASELLERSLAGWQLDTIALAELTGNRPLSCLGCFLFERLGLVAHFGLDCQKLGAFFVELEAGYDDAVQYHNRTHAASVMHLMYAILRSGRLAQKAAIARGGGGSEGGLGSGALETMACLLAAAAHDYEHVGHNNDFLVKSGHERAVLYNDRHVNENHHAAAAFALLRRPGLDFLAELPAEDFASLRRLFVDLVLGTDMACSHDILKTFNDALQCRAATRSAPLPSSSSLSLPLEHVDFTPSCAQEATRLLQVALKCADLGHLALERPAHLQFVQRLEEEFFRQGDHERAHGLPVSFMMDRRKPGASSSQVGFFDNVAMPMFRSLVMACPSLKPLLEAVQDNYLYWRDLQGEDAAKDVASPSSELQPRPYSDEDGDAMVAASSLPSGSSEPGAQHDDFGERAGRRRSGRARQRKAKWLAAVRCRTPSPM